MYEMARHPEDQAKIRAEVAEARLRAGDEPFTSNDYDAMHYMNAVIKEVLRMYPIVANLSRVASRDDVLPLAKPIVGVNGEQLTSIPVRKGQLIVMAMSRYNR